MDRHPYFDLLLHTDEELSLLLGQQIAARVTLHEWPLSCVQRLLLSDGQTRIYKSSRGPTVEVPFYQAARSPVLPAVTFMAQEGAYAWLLLADLGLPTPVTGENCWTPGEVLAAGKQALEYISAIDGSPPVYQDLSTISRWQKWVQCLEQSLQSLVESANFSHVDAGQIEAIRSAAVSSIVQREWGGAVGLVHSDLTQENVFMTHTETKIIDWQRPIHGPVAIDLVNFVESHGHDPTVLVGQGAVWLRNLLRAGWFVECSLRWFPAGIAEYDRAVSKMCFS